MKNLFILIIILLSINISFGQEEKDNFFFTKEMDSLGVSYGKCLTQPNWVIEFKKVKFSEEIRYIEQKETIDYDTIYLDFYFLENKEQLKHISHLVDTSEYSLEIKKESRKLLTCSATTIEYCFETITEQYIQTPSYEKWDSGKSLDISNSQKWKTKEIEEQHGVTAKRVIRTPDCCGLGEIIIPAEYTTVIKITAKKDLKNHELNNIKLLCKNSYIQETSTSITSEVIVPSKTKIQAKKVLLKPAEVELKEIISNPSQTLIALIQKQLKTLGFYQSYDSGELDVLTKEAIIKYQLKHNLPFGQLTEETVNHILLQETSFNK